MPKGVYPRKSSGKAKQIPNSEQFESLARVLQGLGQTVATGFNGIAERLTQLERRVQSLETTKDRPQPESFVVVYSDDDDVRYAVVEEASDLTLSIKEITGHSYNLICVLRFKEGQRDDLD